MAFASDARSVALAPALRSESAIDCGRCADMGGGVASRGGVRRLCGAALVVGLGERMDAGGVAGAAISGPLAGGGVRIRGGITLGGGGGPGGATNGGDG